MLLHAAEMHVEFMEMLQKRSERRSLGHFGEGIHILGETLAAIAELAVGTRDVGAYGKPRVNITPIECAPMPVRPTN